MAALKAVDAEAAAKAKELLDPFRDAAWLGVSNLAIVLTAQRADRLEQAIAEAIHEAANRPNNGNSPIFVAEPGR